MISTLSTDQWRIKLSIADRMSWPSRLILVPLCASVPRSGHVIRLTFPIRKGTVTLTYCYYKLTRIILA
jgi:hypothetical protein